MNQVDKLFETIHPDLGGFAFDDQVAQVFDDMISRSVPLYTDVQRSIPKLIQLLPHAHLKVVDLGCSTGTSLIHLSGQLPDHALELIGVDSSAAMLEKCTAKIATAGLRHSVQTHCSRIQDYEFTQASVVLMNYTLQFVPRPQREDVLKSIHSSLADGGFMMLSEKVASPEPAFHNTMTELYFEYKRRMGYSELEISRKRDSLENVLVPLTLDENIRMIQDAGFSRIELLLKWFNFATLLCYK